MKWHNRFFWLLLLFLPTQLGYHSWPEWTLVLGRRVDYLSPTVYFTDILIGFIMVAWFLSSRDPAGWRGVAISNINFMRLLRFARNDKVRKAGIVIIATLLFAAVNIFVAANQMVAFYKWIKMAEFVMLGWYIVRSKPKLSTIITPLSIGVFYSSVLAIAQFFLQHSVGGPLWWLGERTFILDTPGIARIDWYGRELLRPYATFPHPNVLGGYLAVLLPLTVLRYLSILGNLKKKRKYFYGSVILVGIIALLMTFSRSAIIIGILALIFVFFQKKKIFFSLAILFLTFSVFRFPFTFFEESVVVRQQLNVAAIKLWTSAPLFGVGLGNFLVRLPEALPFRTIYFLQPVHNIYLLLLSEVGVVGFLFLVWFLQKAFRHSFSIWHLAFGILLVLGLVDHYPLSLQQGQLMLTILAALCISGITYEKN